VSQHNEELQEATSAGVDPSADEHVAEEAAADSATVPAADQDAPATEDAFAAVEEPAAEEPAVEEPAAPAEEPAAEEPAAEEPAATPEEPVAEEPAATGEAEVLASDDVPGEEVAFDATVTGDGVIEADDATVADVEGVVEADAPPRARPAIPGADLEVDIVAEGEDPLTRAEAEAAEEAARLDAEQEALDDQPITAAIELAADARYRATGKRKTAVARVLLRPGTGAYLINGRTLDEFFPRDTLQRTIRQPLETVGYETRMDVVARMHGGGVAAQAGALRHGISRALLEADPNLRGELKRRGFLTRDARVKERKKAGLKKARKRPQFSKR
jgi:small subunit ribosomal protein S9